MTLSVVQCIDHAVLKPAQTAADVRSACELCKQLAVASLCVKPCHVPIAAELLADSTVAVSTVIGFPHGGTSTAAKVAEAHYACAEGAAELDMVVNLGRVFEENWDVVASDVRAVVDAGKSHQAITKVILETGLLPYDEWKVRLCEISEEAGAAFVKTSTGFGYTAAKDGQLAATGASEADVRLMRKTCSTTVGVKASGGIRTYADALKFVELGATRLGTSATQAIAAGAAGLTSIESSSPLY